MNERKYKICITAGSRELVAVDYFRLAESSVNVLFGESGIGKSLIALAISGLLDPDELNVNINEESYETYLSTPEVADIRRNGFFVFQEPSSHLNPMLTLRAQLNEGSIAHVREEVEILDRLWRQSPKPEIQRILDVYPKPYRPSGGEKQRILAAMAFKKMSTSAKETPGALFVFDEPTGNLDDRLRNEFLDLLVENFRNRRITVLLITHDYSMVSRLVKAYQDIAKKILYKELVLEGTQLRMREFLPSEYLSWLENRRRPASVPVEREALLRFESGAHVFGRSFTISRDVEGKDPAPLVVQKGRMTYLKAPSGTGKTTILKLMMGLIKPEKMMMRLFGTVYSENTPRRIWQRQVWGRLMTMVFQHADEALNQNSDVKGVFAGLRSQKRMDDSAIVRILSELFEDEISPDFLAKRVKHLSGGQKQRLNLLRSMILDTQILLLDEPLNGLDLISSIKVISKIEEKLRTGKGVLVVSHNEEIFDTMVATENVRYLTASA